MEEKFDDDFGQKIDLTVKIREILRNYPEGTSILKEIIQNSDDASAKEVAFCLDKRKHNEKDLVYPNISPYMGASLLAFNNSIFTEQDFISIQRIGDSMKKSDANEQGKTGRFGVGFNSVYHITDLPSFVSGSKIVYFDPQAKFLPDVNVNNPGKMIDFLKNAAVIEKNPNQFVPFLAFGCTMRESFKGTMFRLPLRTAAQAISSRISDIEHTIESIQKLLNDFQAEAPSTLLFLKNIEKISIYEWLEGEKAPKLLFSTCIANITPKLQMSRRIMFEPASTFAKCAQKDDLVGMKKALVSATSDFTLSIENFHSLTNDTERNDWLVFNQYGGGEASNLTLNNYKRSMKLIPFGGVAVPIKLKTIFQGDVYCFLPLPIRSSVPVSINGYFELSSNRRDLWFGNDMLGDGAIRAAWNAALVRDIIAPSWARLINYSKANMPLEEYYNLWPTLLPIDSWKSLLIKTLISLLTPNKVLYTSASKGKWITFSEAIVLPTQNDEKTNKSLGQILLNDNFNIVLDIPENVKLFLINNGVLKNIATPDFIRDLFFSSEKFVNVLNFPRDVSFLLDYIISKKNPSDCEKLVGLPLVPLVNGSVGSFDKAASNVTYYICNEVEYSLLSKAGHLVISTIVSDITKRFLMNPAVQQKLNVKVCMPGDLLLLLDHVFPKEYKSLPYIDWNEENIDQPSKEWISSLWKYLSTFRDLSLKSIENSFPLLPCIQGERKVLLSLCNTSRNCIVIDATNLNSIIKEVTIQIGMFSIDFDSIGCGDNKTAISKYYVDPSQENIVICLENMINRKAVNNGLSKDEWLASVFSSCKVDSVDIFRLFLSQIEKSSFDRLSSNYKSLLLQLPIYRLYPNDGNFFSRISLMNMILIDSNDIQKEVIPSTFIQYYSVTERDFLLSLGLNIVTKSDFYKNYFFPRLTEIPTKIREVECCSLLSNLHILSHNNASFREFVKRTPFITTGDTANEVFSAIHQLYDPEIVELSLLLPIHFFPSSCFCNSEILVILRSLGLQSSMNRAGIIKSAQSIENALFVSSDKIKDIDEKIKNTILNRAQFLLRYADLHSERLFLDSNSVLKQSGSKMVSNLSKLFITRESKESKREGGKSSNTFIPDPMPLNAFLSELNTIHFIPIYRKRICKIMPWFYNDEDTSTKSTVPPYVAQIGHVRHNSEAWLCSYSLFILEGEVVSPILKDVLGWNSPIKGMIIANQLIELSALWSLYSTENSTEKIDSSDFSLLSASLPFVYEELQRSMADEGTKEGVLTILNGIKSVWHGNGFTLPSSIAFKCPIQATPYIYQLPANLYPYKDLFILLGVRLTFGYTDYLLVLQNMATDTKNKTLSESQLDVSIAVIQTLSDNVMKAGESEIFVPDINKILVPAAELVYNDASWISDTNLMGLHRFIHPKISNTVAHQVGVKSLRTSLVASNVDKLDFGIESFGQAEPLTRRLRHILELYPEGPSILNELLQNADDAGAKNVKILLNIKQYETSALLGPKMAEWQGPALYFYNDAPFSQSDFHNLSRIGQSSKLNKLASTGRFGLGFNSVYHFTDLPSIVSSDYVVYFDPHTSFVPGATINQPGIRIKFTDTALKDQFPDQFASYSFFGCNMKDNFNGTLFRFPLRNEKMAKLSEISSNSSNVESILNLLTSFHSSSAHSILFLKSVNSIEVSIKLDDESEPQLFFSTKRTISHVESWNRIQTFIEGEKTSKKLSKEAFYQKLLNTPINNLPSSCCSLTITVCDFSNPILSLKNEGEGEKKKDEIIINNLENPLEMSYKYVVSSSLGGGKARAMACDPKHYDMKFLPWASVACLVDINGVLVDKQPPGRAFSFLPLPCESYLPVSINGYFELSSNRRDLWYDSTKDLAGLSKIRSTWNANLLSDVVSPTYLMLLTALKNSIKKKSEKDPNIERNLVQYMNLFPSSLPTSELWQIVVRNLYKCVVEKELFFSPKLKSWVSSLNAVLISDSVSADLSEIKYKFILKVLLDEGVAVVPLSLDILELMKKLSFPVKYVSPSYIRSIFKVNKEHLSLKVDKMIADMLLLYCLSDLKEEEDFKELLGLKLLNLSNGTLGDFTSTTFLCNSNIESAILSPFISHLLIDLEILPDLKKLLSNPICQMMGRIKIVTPDILCGLLPLCLPKDWKNFSEVDWLPGSSDTPSVDWITLLWKYINSLTTVKDFEEKLPLLPTLSIATESLGRKMKLVKLCKNSNVVFAEGQNPLLISLLNKVGVLLLNSEILSSHTVHVELWNYMNKASAKGVITAIYAAVNEDVSNASFNRLFEKVTREERVYLNNFLFDTIGKEHYTLEHLNVIRHLPIFETYGLSEEDSNILLSFTNLVSEKFFPPESLKGVSVPVEFLSTNFIKLNSTNSKEMLIKLGVKHMNICEFYRSNILESITKLTPTLRNKAVIQLLINFPTLNEEDAKLNSTLRVTPCIPDASNEMKMNKISDLFDPSVTTLVDILPNAAFPSKEFRDSLILLRLRGLGLQTLLSPSSILQSTISIAEDSLIQTLQFEALERSSRLFKYLDLHHEQIINSAKEVMPSFLSTLKNTKWIRIITNPINDNIPWINVNTKNSSSNVIATMCANDIRPNDENVWLCSAEKGILFEESVSSSFKKILEWDTTISSITAAKQVIAFAYMHEIKNDLLTFNLEFKQRLAFTIPVLYKLIEVKINDDSFTEIMILLNKSKWIYVENSFLSFDQIAFNCASNLAPYLFKVPEDLLPFEILLRTVGVRSDFSGGDFVKALSSFPNNVLDDHQIASAITIASSLAKELREKRYECKGTRLPDLNGIMQDSTVLIYNDANWMQGLNNQIQSRLLHPSVSIEDAAILGCKSLRVMVLASQQSTQSLNCPSVKNIKESIGESSNDLTFLGDILEVADLMSASFVDVLFDYRNHPTTSLLNPLLSSLQGPSIVIRFAGVQMNVDNILHFLTSFTKSSRRGSTRYGCGLLSSFLISDCLQILSGESLYIFDPIGGMLLGDNGKKDEEGYSGTAKIYPYLEKNMASKFIDQFQPFVSLPYRFSPDKMFNGTIIRLSLRTRASALADSVFDEERIANLFASFNTELANYLLFSRQLEHLSLQKWLVDDTAATLCLNSTIRNLTSEIKENRLGVYNPKSKSKNERKNSGGNWLTNLFNNKFIAPTFFYNLEITSTYILLPRPRIIVQQFVIYSTYGIGRLHELSVKFEALSYKPILSCAALISIKSDLRNDPSVTNKFEGLLFSQMPTRVKTGLPVHLNGDFALRSSDKFLYDVMDYTTGLPNSLNDEERIRCEWNSCLLNEFYSSVYGPFLIRVRDLLILNSLTYNNLYKHWPSVADIAPQFSVNSYKDFIEFIIGQDLFLILDRSSSESSPSLAFKGCREGYFSVKDMTPLLFTFCQPHFLIFQTPPFISKDIGKFTNMYQTFLPANLISYLRANQKSYYEEIMLVGGIPLAVDILTFCLSSDETNSTANLDILRSLSGLHLLPLQNSELAKITPRGGNVIIATSNQQQLLPNHPELFLLPYAFDKLKPYLINAEIRESLGIAKFSSTVLSRHLVKVLPKEWKGKTLINWDPESDSFINKSWIYLFWSEIDYLDHGSTDLFLDWCLIPTKNNQLVSIKCKQLVVNFWSLNQSISLKLELDAKFTHDEEESNSVERLPVPTQPVFTLSSRDQTRLKELSDFLENVGALMLEFAYFRDPLPLPSQSEMTNIMSRVVNILKEMSNITITSASGESKLLLNWTSIKNEERDMLISHIASENESENRLSNTAKAALKTMPLFKLFNGNYVSISGAQYYTIDNRVNLSELGLSEQVSIVDKNQVLLEAKPSLLALYSDFGIKQLDESSLIESFLLPHFSDLNVSGRESLIRFIQDRWPTLCSSPSLLQAMMNLRFICIENSLYRAKDLFDPRNSLLFSIFKDDVRKFPPAIDHTNASYLDFLVDIGLCSSIDLETFVLCAKQIETYKGSEISNKIVDDVTNLILHLFTNLRVTTSFLKSISNIQFIPVCMPSSLNSFSFEGYALQKYNACAIPDDLHLIWSTVPVLGASLVPPSQFFKDVGISHPPQIDMIVKHILNITIDEGGGGLLDRWPFTTEGNVVSMFQKIFAYLDSNWALFSKTSLGTVLMNRACVPIGNRLVKPSRLFFRLPENLDPFMFEIPRSFGAHDAFFKLLGARESAETSNYIDFLRELYNECKKEMLSPNELLAVLKVLSLITKDTSFSCDVSNIFIPDCNGILRTGELCFFNDSAWLSKRINLSAIGFVHGRITLVETEKLGVKKLSESIFQVLNEPPSELILTTASLPNSSNFLKDFSLYSGYLSNALAWIILHETPTSDRVIPLPKPFSTSKRSVFVTDIEEVGAKIQFLFDKYVFEFVNSIRCSYFLSSSGVDVTSVEPYENLIYLHSKLRKILLSKSKMLFTKMSPFDAGAIALNDLLGNIIKDIIVVSALLENISTFHFKAAEEDRDVALISTSIKEVLYHFGIETNLADIDWLFRCVPGKILIKNDVSIVQLSPLRSFSNGEIIAYFDKLDNEFKYGIIKELCNEEMLSDNNTLIKSYCVQINSTEIETKLSSDIYSFSTASLRAQLNMSNNNNDNNNNMSESKKEENKSFLKKTVLSNGKKGDEDNSLSLSNINLKENVFEEREVLAAVNDILARSNLSLDMDQALLMEEHMKMQKQIKTLNEEIKEVKIQRKTASDENAKIKSSLLCQICFARDVDKILIPCSHLICSICQLQLRFNMCPFDRKMIHGVYDFRSPF